MLKYIRKNKTILRTILKFGIVGLLNTLIDYTIFQAIIYFTHNHSSAFIFVASFMSGSVAVVNSYIFNKKWTFRDKSTDYVNQILRFVGINIASVSINSALVALFTKLTPSTIVVLNHPFTNLIFTKAASILIVMILNFIAYKLWVFELHKNEEDILS